MMWLRADWKGRLLDVGCGNGELLARARGLGWDVGGIEPDPTASQVARSSGIPILASRLDEAALPAESFDAITLSHVVEHLLEPVATLRQCARVLKPGGRLVLATPNTHSLGHGYWRKNWVGLDPPRHIFLFSPRSLRRCVEEAGLEVAELRTVSRFASWMWAASRGIRRRGHFPLENLRHRGLLGWAESLTAMSLESLTTPFFHSGEEIVLIATPPPAR
jgi:2-polyprenyl-3-methyl-5-hydroxy-6-metoxy-1,4-benzoquinol methylase